MMRLFFVVHGFVQGTGYRALVKRIADRYGVRGMVRNADNGTVEILAEADDEALKAFEDGINVDVKNGPSVMSIEKHYEDIGIFPKSARNYENFIIEK